MFRCDACGKSFQHNSHLLHHKRAQHEGVSYSCLHCGKKFTRRDVKNKHETKCSQPRVEHRCHICNRLCATAHGLTRHVAQHTEGVKRKALNVTNESQPSKKSREQPLSRSAESLPGPSRESLPLGEILYQREPRPSMYRCRRCNERFDNRRDLYLHGMQSHYQVGGQLQDTPWGNGPAPWEGDDETDDRLKTVYEANAPLILQTNAPGPNISVYNFPAGNDVDENQISEAADAIYQQQDHAFKMNLSFGVILRNRETGEYRYFRPFYNDSVLDRPLYISKRRDLRTLTLKLRRMDLFTLLLQQRPDTKWIPVLVTNFRFTVFHTFYPIGELQGPLPDYVKNNHAIVGLERNVHTGQAYEDNYCAFRCLVLHYGYDVRSMEGQTNHMFNTWARYKGGITDFKGITFEDLPDFEVCFQVNIEVYSLNSAGYAGSVYKSRGRFDSTLYVHLYQGHFSYIKDFADFAKKFQCKFCDKLWEVKGNYLRHEQKCRDKTRFVYPGGFHKQSKTIFEELSYYGIHCPEQVYPWFVVYDYEALLHKVQGQGDG